MLRLQETRCYRRIPYAAVPDYLFVALLREVNEGALVSPFRMMRPKSFGSYPHILIDESQDIGTMHQAILELLIKAGVQVSLIGDPSQSIDEFAGATGEFLRAYTERKGGTRGTIAHCTRSLRSRILCRLATTRPIAGRPRIPVWRFTLATKIMICRGFWTHFTPRSIGEGYRANERRFSVVDLHWSIR